MNRICRVAFDESSFREVLSLFPLKYHRCRFLISDFLLHVLEHRPRAEAPLHRQEPVRRLEEQQTFSGEDFHSKSGPFQGSGGRTAAS